MFRRKSDNECFRILEMTQDEVTMINVRASHIGCVRYITDLEDFHKNYEYIGESFIPLKVMNGDDGFGGLLNAANFEIAKSFGITPEDLENKPCDCGGLKEYKSMDSIFHYEWCKSRKNESK